MSVFRGRAELTLVFISFIWGATFVVVKDALHDVSTLLFLALRFSFALVLLLVFFRGKLSAPLDRRSLLGGILCGTFLFFGYAFQTAGLRHTTASKSAFLTGLYIVLVPLLIALLTRKVPRRAELLGAVAATAGTALMTSTALGFDLNSGDILTLVCAFAFSAHIVAVSRWTHRMNYEWLTVLQVAGVALLSLLSFFWIEPPAVRWTPRLLSALAITGVLATALSFSLYTWAQRHTTAVRAALIFALEPVFAGLIAWVWGHENWSLRSLFGAGLILAGILLVEIKPPRRTSETPASP